jgi:predicted Zn-dependent protease
LLERRTREGITEQIRVREALEREFRETGTIASPPDTDESSHLPGETHAMPEKSRKRLMLEASLLEDPADTFLRYGLALQCLRDGDVVEGRERLQALIADHPADQVAAHQQLGQSYLEAGEFAEARATLQAGIALAYRTGERHAAAEMEGLLGSIG